MTAASGLSAPRLALSQQEAAAALGVSIDYFQDHLRQEIRRGRRRLYPINELQRWLDENASQALADQPQKRSR